MLRVGFKGFLIGLWAGIVLVSGRLVLAEDGPGLPYIGSEYHQRRELPYDRCFLGDGKYGIVENSGNIGIGIYGRDLGLLPWDRFYLICSTSEKDYHYQIPVQLSPMHYVGLAVELSRAGTTQIKATKLDGKRVSDLFGWYRGPVVGATALIGGKVGTMKNSYSSIRLRTLNFEVFAAGVTAAVEFMEVKPDGDYLVSFGPSGKEWVRDIEDYQFVKVHPKLSFKGRLKQKMNRRTHRDYQPLVSEH